jgi:hypothetical protein
MFAKIVSLLSMFCALSLLGLSAYSQYGKDKQLSEEILIQKEAIANVNVIENDISSAFLKYASKNKGSSYILAAEAVSSDSRKCSVILKNHELFLDKLINRSNDNFVRTLFLYLISSSLLILSITIIILFRTDGRKTKKKKALSKQKKTKHEL